MGSAEKEAGRPVIQKLTLVGEYEGLVKRFVGFDKSRHTVPKFASDRAQLFLARLAEPEIIEGSEERFSAFREAMGYRRKDSSSVVDAGVARIESKDFTLERRYSLIEDSPDRYRVETELLEAGSLDLLENDGFNHAAGGLFERLRCLFRREVSVEALVDGMEEHEESGLSVDYPSTCAFCDARFEGMDAVFRFDSVSLEIRFPGFGMPRQLIAAYRAMAEQLADIPDLGDWLRID